MKIKILDYKFDELEIDRDPLFRTEKYLQTIPLNKNLITHGGFNFRKNTLIKRDSLLSISSYQEEILPFIDYTFFH